jgi:hypothetical protein
MKKILIILSIASLSFAGISFSPIYIDDSKNKSIGYEINLKTDEATSSYKRFKANNVDIQHVKFNVDDSKYPHQFVFCNAYTDFYNNIKQVSVGTGAYLFKNAYFIFTTNSLSFAVVSDTQYKEPLISTKFKTFYKGNMWGYSLNILGYGQTLFVESAINYKINKLLSIEYKYNLNRILSKDTYYVTLGGRLDI